MKLTTEPIVQKPEEVISLSLDQANPRDIYINATADNGKSCCLGVFRLSYDAKICFYPFDNIPEVFRKHFELTPDGRIAHSYEGDSRQ